MASIDKFKFGAYDSTITDSPFLDSSYVNPSSENETRKQMGYPLVELKNYINDTFIDAVNKAIAEITSSKGGNVQSNMDRWLRFDADNKQGLIIKSGTSIKLPNGTYKTFSEDTKVDLSSYITSEGADYFVYIDDTETVKCYTSKSTSNGTYMGRFHTLCANVGTITIRVPANGITSGGKILLKPYREETDSDFYNFYNKDVTSVTTGTRYDQVFCAHPLNGYNAKDILPESIWCVGFEPNSLYDDAMVYDVVHDVAIDIYLQSGTGYNTRSKYNATHTVSREPINHQEDFRMVGKRMLEDDEFISFALGSNEQTNITGSSDKTTVGGHVDTAGRRMISIIGGEEACGYLWQWLRSGQNANGGSAWATYDNDNKFGQSYGIPYALRAGGNWASGASCGSRSRDADGSRSSVGGDCGSRGLSPIKRQKY